jgi:hypothetical protein
MEWSHILISYYLYVCKAIQKNENDDIFEKILIHSWSYNIRQRLPFRLLRSRLK